VNHVPADLKTDVQISIIEGPSDVLKQETTRALAEGWLGDDLEFGLSILDARSDGLQAVLAGLASGSLMAARRLVVVRDVTALPAEDQERLARALGALDPDVAVALVPTKEGWDNKRGTPRLSRELLKVARARGQSVRVVTPPPRELPAWVTVEMRRRGKSIDAEAARLLVETAGEDIDRLLSEMDKLATYAGPMQQDVTEADVQAVSVATAEEKIWDFLDAIGLRDSGLALKLLDGMLPEGATKGAAIPLLGSIARHLRLLWQVRLLYSARALPGSLSELPEEVAAKLPQQQNINDAVKGRDWLLRKYAGQARKFSDADLARAMERVYRADRELKGQAQLEDRTIMELLVVELCDAGA